ERVPVLACRDALRAAGAEVTTLAAGSDQEIDPSFADLDDERRLVVAAATDGEVRAVIRRMVRRYAPPPSKRPDDLPPDRTVYDLPPIGILPLDARTPPDLVKRLGLPTTPERVAEAVLSCTTRWMDLFRKYSESVTQSVALIGGAAEQDMATAWYARIEVAHALLSDGTAPMMACVVTNAAGYGTVDDLPLAG